MGALAFVTTVWTMPPNPKQKIPGGPDWLGTAIITVGLTLVLFCLSQGPAVGWNTGYVVALLVIGCVCWPVFVFYEIWVEKRGWTPMLRMSKWVDFPYGKEAGCTLTDVVAFWQLPVSSEVASGSSISSVSGVS